MIKRFAFMAFALLFGAGLVTSCGDKDEDAPQPSETPTEPETPVATVAGSYTGWTLGSNAYAAFIPSDNDKLTITIANAEATRCDIAYTSDTWGTALLKDVAFTMNDTAFIFSKPITATLRQDRSAWDFSSAVDSIAMPNRNPEAGTATVKNYPITLAAGYMSLDKSRWQFDFKTYLVPRSEHIQNMSFRHGHIPAGRTE